MRAVSVEKKPQLIEVSANVSQTYRKRIVKPPWRTQIASDLIHDGLGLELVDRSGQVVAEVFRCDADHTVTIRAFDSSVPSTLLRELAEEARDCLHPFEDGTPLPANFITERTGREAPVSKVTDLHDAVKRGDVAAIKALLEENPNLANSVSESDARGTYPLHVAAEFGQAEAARVLLE